MPARRPRPRRRTCKGRRGLLRRAAHVESLEPRLVLDSTVVFSEVMYNPRDSQQLEWIELHSEMAVDMDLSGWRIGGVGYTFPAGTIIPGGEYLVIAKSPSELQIASGFSDALGPYTGRLSNSSTRRARTPSVSRRPSKVRVTRSPRRMRICRRPASQPMWPPRSSRLGSSRRRSSAAPWV